MKKKSKYEAFKIASDLMRVIREHAKEDERSIKATIERVLRERFCAEAPR